MWMDILGVGRSPTRNPNTNTTMTIHRPAKDNAAIAEAHVAIHDSMIDNREQFKKVHFSDDGEVIFTAANGAKFKVELHEIL